jgi:glycine cleavage system regulatory protein
MEARLIEIIKTGKGEIKDILLAEKELGEWREKIEVFEGEIRFYSNMVSLSTLTLTLLEKDIKSPSLVSVTETVDTGIESEDVLKAEKDLRTLIADAKGRITSSDLKKLAADQFSLNIACEVPPENAGVLRDRLNQLGRVARLDVQTATTDNGTGRPVGLKEKRSDTVFRISIYNTTNVQPRETSYVSLACHDVEKVFRAIVARVGEAGGRVVQSNLNRLKADQVDGLVQFDVPVAKGEALLAALKDDGEVMNFKVVENPDSANVTKSKKGFHVVLLAMAHVAARETTTLRFAAVNVAETQRKLQALVLEKKGRILDARLNEDRATTSPRRSTSRSPPTGPRSTTLKASGEVIGRNVARAADDGRVVDAKVRASSSDPDGRVRRPAPHREARRRGVGRGRRGERITKAVTEGGGQARRQPELARDPNGRTVSQFVYEAPLNAPAGFVDQIRKTGTVRVEETRRNPLAPKAGPAIGRIELTLSNEDPLVGRDAGFAAQMKDALRSVIGAAGFSLKFILIGALIVVPWALIVWLTWKVVRRMRAKPAAGV